MSKRVLSVGQCGFDDSRIGRVLRELGLVVERAYSGEDARKKLREGAYALVLVNRVFDGDGDSGVAFIGEARQEGTTVPMMLVSNYADAQAAAVANGALMGFGKDDLEGAGVEEMVRAAVGS